MNEALNNSRIYKTFLAAVKTHNTELIEQIIAKPNSMFTITLNNMPYAIGWVLKNQKDGLGIDMRYVFSKKKLYIDTPVQTRRFKEEWENIHKQIMMPISSTWEKDVEIRNLKEALKKATAQNVTTSSGTPVKITNIKWTTNIDKVA